MVARSGKSYRHSFTWRPVRAIRNRTYADTCIPPGSTCKSIDRQFLYRHDYFSIEMFFLRFLSIVLQGFFLSYRSIVYPIKNITVFLSISLKYIPMERGISFRLASRSLNSILKNRFNHFSSVGIFLLFFYYSFAHFSFDCIGLFENLVTKLKKRF